MGFSFVSLCLPFQLESISHSLNRNLITICIHWAIHDIRPYLLSYSSQNHAQLHCFSPSVHAFYSHCFKMLKIFTPIWTAIKFLRFERLPWRVCDSWCTAWGKWINILLGVSAMKFCVPSVTIPDPCFPPKQVGTMLGDQPCVHKSRGVRCRCVSDLGQPIFHPFYNRLFSPPSLDPLCSIRTGLLYFLTLSDWR